MRFRVALACLLLTTMLAPIPATATGPAATAGIQPAYTALGDSYSSGAGTGTGQGPCVRSADAYPQLYADLRPGPQFFHDACYGASIDAINATQLTHLDPATSLVTLTAGITDADFSGVLLHCLFYDTAGCRNQADRSITTISKTLPDKLAALHTSLRTAAPHARIIVLGYPHLWDEPGTCPIFGTPEANQQQMNRVTTALNETVRTAAEAQGATYLDVTALFTGHGICSPDPWVNGFTGFNFDGFHPNRTGHRLGYLAALKTATGLG